MKPIEENGHVSMVILIMVTFNVLFLSANGLFMLIAPEAWYEFVPGVTDTGFFNQHFIRDIGLIQLFLGVAFGVGLVQPERRIGLVARRDLVARRACRLPPVGSGRGHLFSIGPSSRLPRRQPPRNRRSDPDPLGAPSAARPPGCIRLISDKTMTLRPR